MAVDLCIDVWVLWMRLFGMLGGLGFCSLFWFVCSLDLLFFAALFCAFYFVGGLVVSWLFDITRLLVCGILFCCLFWFSVCLFACAYLGLCLWLVVGFAFVL